MKPEEEIDKEEFEEFCEIMDGVDKDDLLRELYKERISANFYKDRANEVASMFSNLQQVCITELGNVKTLEAKLAETEAEYKEFAEGSAAQTLAEDERETALEAKLESAQEENRRLREALEAQEKYHAHFDSCNKCDPGAIALPCGAQDLSLTAYKLRKQALARPEKTTDDIVDHLVEAKNRCLVLIAELDAAGGGNQRLRETVREYLENLEKALGSIQKGGTP